MVHKADQALPEIENPVDIIEEILSDQGSFYERLDENEIFLEKSGKMTTYRMGFFWHEPQSILLFSGSLDIKIPEKKLPEIYKLLSYINERLMLGVLYYESNENTIIYRHSMLINDEIMSNQEQIEDLLELAVMECDRFYPAFQYTLWTENTASQAFDICMFDTEGEA